MNRGMWTASWRFSLVLSRDYEKEDESRTLSDSGAERDLTPGQFLVLYDAEVVLGGGIICEAQHSML